MNTDDDNDGKVDCGREKNHAHIIKIASEREHLRMVINKHKTQKERGNKQLMKDCTRTQCEQTENYGQSI